MSINKFENNQSPKQTDKKSETDEFNIDKFLEKREAEERAEMSPEELAEDDEKRKRVASAMRWLEKQRKLKTGTAKEKKQAKKELKAEKKELEKKVTKLNAILDDQDQKSFEVIKQQTYEQINNETEQFRKKYNIKMSEVQLKEEEEEDKKLKRRLGLE